jgi:hypothetical protein
MGRSSSPARSTEDGFELTRVAKEATEHEYPFLYQINTRALLNELSRGLRHRARLDDISDGELDRLASEGFDWLWFLGVRQTGLAGRDVSRAKAE